MRRSSTPFRNFDDHQRVLAILPQRFAEAPRASDSWVVMMLSFCCGTTPINQRAVSTLLNRPAATVTTWFWPFALEFDLDGLAVAVLGDLLELDLRVNRLAVHASISMSPFFRPAFSAGCPVPRRPI